MRRQRWDGESDEELMRLVQGNDKAAFAELVRRYEPRIRNKIRSDMWGRDAVAEDLTQDVFLKLWEKRAAWRGDSDVGTYIYAMVRNRCASYITREKRKRGRLLPGADADMPALEPGFARVDARDTCEALSGVLDTIPERFRVPLVLYAYGGLKTEEIAKLLGLTVRTVDYRLSMARRMLRERMGE